MKKFLKYGLLVLFILILALGIFIKISTYGPEAPAVEAMKEDNVTEARHFILFEPETIKANFVFYSGGFVEAESYAVMAKILAENDIRTFIIKSPFNLAIISPSRFDDIIEKYPSDAPWYIGGHSLGGSSAVIGLDKTPHEIKGLVLLGSYGIESIDFSQTKLEVISIRGSEDQILNLDNYIDRKEQLPPSTDYKVIEGGNHSGFGYYGDQKNDGIASISNDQQHDIYTSWLIEFMIKE